MTAKRVRAYFSQEEYNQLTSRAGEAGLSLSSFIKQSSLGVTISSTVDHEAVLALVQSKADLGRLGGILKQHLGKPGEAGYDREELRSLLKDIEGAQRILAAKFDHVAQALLMGK